MTMWFHGAADGLKLHPIETDPRVGFEADCFHNLISDEKACKHTMEYGSVIGCGNIELCSDSESKRRGLNAFMRRYAQERVFDFSDSELSGVCVLQLDVMQVTGKKLKSVVCNRS